MEEIESEPDSILGILFCEFLYYYPSELCFFARFYWLYLGFWSFEFVSDFEIRISNFLAAALPRQVFCGHVWSCAPSHPQRARHLRGTPGPSR
jgi:hypothetical protein